jgi:CRISPR-associated protein Cas2
MEPGLAMHMLVTYDVCTTTPEGERRLRRVAQACLDFGQRVQKSVFECSVTEVQFEKLRPRLLAEVNLEEDSLRIYRLPENVEQLREIHGRKPDVDFTGPLVV